MRSHAEFRTFQISSSVIGFQVISFPCTTGREITGRHFGPLYLLGGVLLSGCQSLLRISGIFAALASTESRRETYIPGAVLEKN